MPCADCVNKTAESQKIRRIGGTHCLISHLPLAPRPLPSGFQIPRRFRPQQLRPPLPRTSLPGDRPGKHWPLLPRSRPGLPRPPGPRSGSSPAPVPPCCPSQLGSHLGHQLGPVLQTLQPRDPAVQAPPPVTHPPARPRATPCHQSRLPPPLPDPLCPRLPSHLPPPTEPQNSQGCSLFLRQPDPNLGVKNPPEHRRHRGWVQSVGKEDPWRRAWQPTPVILPENPMDTGAWGATVHGATELATTERLSVAPAETPRA